jgi:tetratricopeptide (TPR) repeat protein
MKTNFHIFLLILVITTFQACSSTDSSAGKADSSTSAYTIDGTEISALGALGGLEATPSGPLYTGNGGGNIRLAVLAPQVQGEVPAYLPIYIQGLLNNNFNKYSAVNLIDRQNLDRIIAEQKIAASGSYSDNDFVKIGNLANAQYFLFGTIQKLSGDTYSLQLSITDSSTGVRKANFMKDGSLTQFEGRGTLINEATADILAQLGVQLTEAGKQTLLAGNTSAVKAEAGLARGITAQAGGSEVEALFNFTQAITFDPSQIEALSRLNTLSSTISGGTISQRILNDIQARDRWLEVFKETTRFYNDHPPFEVIFDPNLIQIGETDYVKRTANIGMRIALDSSQAGFDALNALLEGLEKTGKRNTWGFSGWPLSDVTPKTAGTVVFDGRQSLSYKVDVVLVNENNKTIGSGSINLTAETINFSPGDKIVTPPSSFENVISVPNVKTEDLTPTLTIVIAAVNGISSRNLNASGYMKIETGDLEKRQKEYFERGKKNIEQKDYDQAIMNLTRTIRLDINFSEAYYYRGDAYYYNSRKLFVEQMNEKKAILDLAIADYTQAIMLDPNYVEAYLNRGTAYSYNGNVDQDIADCTQVIRLDPNYTIAYFSRGNAYMLKDDYDQAIMDFTKAISLTPNAKTYYWLGDEIPLEMFYIVRGRAYSAKKDYDKAIADYTQAIRINPNYYDMYNDRGDAYFSKGDYDKAITDYTQAIQLDPNYYAYKRRGDVYYDKKDYDKAIADYTLAITDFIKRDDAYYANVYRNRGMAYYDKKDYDRAIVDFSQAIRLDPNFANAYLWRGATYHYGKRDFDRAIADHTQAIRLEPDSAIHYNRRGDAYYYKEDYDKAIADYTQAIRLELDSVIYYNDRGKAYYGKKDYDRAIADFTQAIRLDPDSVIYYNRGKAYYDKKDYDRAIADFTQAIRLDPNFVNAYWWRGGAYHYGKRDYDRAIADYEAALRIEPNNDNIKQNLEEARKARGR